MRTLYDEILKRAIIAREEKVKKKSRLGSYADSIFDRRSTRREISDTVWSRLELPKRDGSLKGMENK